MYTHDDYDSVEFSHRTELIINVLILLVVLSIVVGLIASRPAAAERTATPDLYCKSVNKRSVCITPYPTGERR